MSTKRFEDYSPVLSVLLENGLDGSQQIIEGELYIGEYTHYDALDESGDHAWHLVPEIREIINPMGYQIVADDIEASYVTYKVTMITKKRSRND